MDSLLKKRMTLVKRGIIKQNLLENVAFQEGQPHGFCFNFVGHCTFKCTCCPQSLSELEKEYIDRTIVSCVVDAARNVPTYFQFGARGDNLLHPDCCDMFREIKNSNSCHYLTLNTNGLLMNYSRAREVLQSGIDHITFSLQSIIPEVYRSITNYQYLEKIVRNIEETIRFRDELSGDVSISIQFLDTYENRPYYEQFETFWKKYDVSIYCQKVHSRGNKFDFNVHEEIERYPCLYLWLYPVISHNGNVCSCYADFYEEQIYGNLGELSLSEIWKNSRNRKDMIQQHLNREWDTLPLCKSCMGWSDYENIFRKKGNTFVLPQA